MKIKRFFGKSSCDELTMVRQVFGENAVILYNRVVPDGNEMIAIRATGMHAIVHDEEITTTFNDAEIQQREKTLWPRSTRGRIVDNKHQSVDSKKIDNLYTKLTTLTHSKLNQLTRQYDMVLVETFLNKYNQLPLEKLNKTEIIIQLTRKPESITQAHSMIKQIYGEIGRHSFGIIVPDSTNEQAQAVFGSMVQVAKQLMQIVLAFFGTIPVDNYLSRASTLRRTIIDAFPLAIAFIALKKIAQRLEYKHDSVFNSKQALYN